VECDEQGYVLTGADVKGDVERPPTRLETSMPGVFAVGDVRHGSVKRVASAVGEGASAVGFIHEYLSDDLSAPAPGAGATGTTGRPAPLTTGAGEGSVAAPTA
jgi:thioredoxin reductase (NADPH)